MSDVKGRSLFDGESFVEKDGQYVLEMNIPDNMANAIKVTRTSKTVNIKGKIETVVDRSKDNHVNKFKSIESINKTFSIPPGSIGNTVNAKHQNNKLIITVQK